LKVAFDAIPVFLQERAYALEEKGDALCSGIQERSKSSEDVGNGVVRRMLFLRAVERREGPSGAIVMHYDIEEQEGKAHPKLAKGCGTLARPLAASGRVPISTVNILVDAIR
jgi:hypothetical protein